MDYMISIDWFQVTCKRSVSDSLFAGMHFEGTLDNDKGKVNVYHLTQPREFNAMFADNFEIKIHDFPVASIFANPRPTTLEPGLCMVKIANPLLYTPKWIWYLYDILTGLNWRFHNITRVDLACDFNSFSDNLNPREFIRRYLSTGSPEDETPHYWRVGGNKFYTIGRKKIHTDDAHEKCVGIASDCDYLRFGTRSSGVCTYLYNKTQELNDKGGKQYIRELWAKAGLTDTEECPVYRLEFSISPSAMLVKRNLTDEEVEEKKYANNVIDATLKHWQIRRLVMDDFETQAKIQNIFWTYCQHYFRFRIVGTQKMPHNWEELKLFDIELKLQMKPYLVHGSHDSGVAESNAAKRICSLLSKTNLPISDKLALSRSAEILARYSDVKLQTISPDAIIETHEKMLDGWDFETIVNSGVIPKGAARMLKEYVTACVERDLRNLYDIPQVREMVVLYDAIEAKNAEDYEILMQREQENEVTIRPHNCKLVEDYEHAHEILFGDE